MSATIDNRIVEMQFDNKDFEKNAQQTLGTLDDLKKSLDFSAASQNLKAFGNATKNIDLSGLQNSIDKIKDRFSAAGIAGAEVVRRLTDFALNAGSKMIKALGTPLDVMIQGGKQRAKNIEDAKFQLKGLGITWDSVREDIEYGVNDTAYGLDAAAKAAASLVASGVKVGDAMKGALRGISGVAAMTNANYEEISPIFTTIAGQGKVMTMQLRQLESRGLNVAASMAQVFNQISSGAIKVDESVAESVKKLTKGATVSEAAIRDLVSKGKIGFAEFSTAMDQAFGEHAKKGNETFEGSLANMQAALKKIGAEFATPVLQGLVPVFNQVRLLFNEIKKNMPGVFDFSEKITRLLSEVVTRNLEKAVKFMKEDFTGLNNITNGFGNILKTITRLLAAVKTAFVQVFQPAGKLGNAVNSAAEGFERLTAKLIPSDEALIVIKNILVAIFTVLKNVGTIIGVVLKVVGKVVSVVLKIVAALTSLVTILISSGINLIKNSRLFKEIQKSGGLVSFIIDKIRWAFSKLNAILEANDTIFAKVVNTIRKVGGTILKILGGAIFNVLGKIIGLFSDLMSGRLNLFDYLKKKVEGFKSVIKGVLDYLKQFPIISKAIYGIEKVFNGIKGVFGEISKAFSGFFDKLNFNGSIIDFFKSAIDGLRDSFSNLFNSIKNGEGIFGRIKDFFSRLKEIPIISAAINGISWVVNKLKSALMGLADLINRVFDSFTKGSGKTTASFKPLMINLSFTEKILYGIQTALKAVALVAGGVVTAVGGAIKGLIGLVKALSLDKVFNGIKEFVGKIADLHLVQTAMDAWAASGGKLSAVLSALGTKMGGLFVIIKDAATGVFGFITEKIGAAIKAIVNFFSGFSAGADEMSGATSRASSMIDKVKDKFGSAGDFITTKLSEIRESGLLTKVLLVAFVGAILKALIQIPNAISRFTRNITGENGLFGSITALTKNTSSFFDILKGNLLEGRTLLGSLKNAVEEWGKSSKASRFEAMPAIIRNIAISIAILAGSIALLSALPTEKMVPAAIALGAFAGVMILFATVLAVISKNPIDDWVFKSFAANMIAMAIAVALVAASITAIAIAAKNMEVGGALAAIGIIAGLMVAMFLITKGMSKLDLTGTTLRSALYLVAFAGSIAIVCSTFRKMVEALKGVSFEQLKPAMAAMLTALGGFSIAALLASRIKLSSVLAIGVLALVFGKVLRTLAEVLGGDTLRNLVNNAWKFQNQISKVIIWVTGIVAVMEIAIAAITASLVRTVARAGKSLAWAGAAFLMFGAGLALIAGAFVKFSKLDSSGIDNLIISLGAITVMFALVIFIASKFQNISRDIVSVAGSIALLGVAAIAMAGAARIAQKTDFNGVLKAAFMMITLTVMLGILAKSAQGNSMLKFGTIMGMVLGFVLLVGALMVLALMCDDQQTFYNLLKALGIIVGLMAMMALVLKAAGSIKTGQSWKPIISMIAMLAVVFAGLFLLSKNIQSDKDLWGLIGIAGLVVAVIGSLMLMLSAYLKFAKNNNLGQSKAAEKSMKAFAVMIAALAVVTGVLYILDNFVTLSGGLVGKVGLAIGMLVALAAMALGIIKLSENISGDTSNLIKIGIVMSALMVAMVALTGVLAVLDQLSLENGLVDKAKILGLLFFELAAITIIFGEFGNADSDTFKAIGALGLMMVLFAALSVVALLLDNLQLEGMLAKSQILMLTMAELALIMILIGKFGDDTSSILKGILGLTLMIGLFTILALVAMLLSAIPLEGMLPKTQILMLVMAELAIILIVMGLLGDNMSKALIGVAGLTVMVVLFTVLALVAVLLSAIPLEGMLPKTQILMLVMVEMAAILIIMGLLGSYMAMALIGVVGLTLMTVIFTVLALVCVMLSAIPLDGMLAKTQIIMLVIVELAAIMIILGIPAITLFAALGAVATIALMLMVVVFSILALVCRFIISDIPLDGLLAKTQIIVLVLLELAAMMVILGIPIITVFALLGGVAAVALSIMVIVFGILALVCRLIISDIPLDGLMPKTQTLVLVLLELAGIMVLLGLLSPFAVLGGVAAIALTIMIAVFGLLAVICRFIIADMPLDGLFERTQMLTLVILELVGIIGLMGLISPLALLAIVGLPALLSIIMALVTITGAILLLKDINPSKMREVVDFLVESLYKIIDVIMYLGDNGVGPLLLVSLAIAALGLACMIAGNGVSALANGLASFSNSLESLVPNITAFFNAIINGAASAGASIASGITQVGVAIVSTVMMVITGIISAIFAGIAMILSAGKMLGSSLTEGFKEKVAEFKTLPGDIVQALLDGISGIGTTLLNAGKTMGSKIVEGFREATGWHSPPEFLVKFFKDAGVAVNENAEGVTDLFEGTGEDWGSALSKGFSNTDWKALGLSLVNSLTSGLELGEGGLFAEISDIESMLGALFLTPELRKRQAILKEMRGEYEATYDKYSKLKSSGRATQTVIPGGKNPLTGKTAGSVNIATGASGVGYDLEYVNTQLARAERGMSYVDDELAKLNDEAKTSITEMFDLGNAFDEVTGGAGGAGAAVEDFTSKLTDTLEGQMDIFSKFEEKEAMSKEELLENMRSQIEGMTKWANNMNALAAKGIDQGLYEKLAMMGPQGAEYVGAFASMTAEELAQANMLWEQSLVLPESVSRSISSSFATLGTGVIGGFVNGMTKESATAIDYITNFGSDLWQAFHDSKMQFGSPSIAMFEFGRDAMLGFRDGVVEYMRIAIDAMKFVCNQIEANTKKELSPKKFYNIGKDLLLGLADGLKDKEAIAKLTSRLRELADVLEGGERDAQESQSPSKRWARIGRDLILGLSEGMKNSIGEATGAAGYVADETVESMKNTIAGIADNLLNDDEFTPVITPVLDLTNVQSGAKQLNSMFTTNQALSAMASMNGLQNEQQLEQLNQSRLGTTFIQNNYSPKALNRMEIYRQTRNQFAQYREAMR